MADANLQKIVTRQWDAVKMLARSGVLSEVGRAEKSSDLFWGVGLHERLLERPEPLWTFPRLSNPFIRPRNALPGV